MTTLQCSTYPGCQVRNTTNAEKASCARGVVCVHSVSGVGLISTGASLTAASRHLSPAPSPPPIRCSLCLGRADLSRRPSLSPRPCSTSAMQPCSHVTHPWHMWCFTKAHRPRVPRASSTRRDTGGSNMNMNLVGPVSPGTKQPTRKEDPRSAHTRSTFQPQNSTSSQISVP